MTTFRLKYKPSKQKKYHKRSSFTVFNKLPWHFFACLCLFLTLRGTFWTTGQTWTTFTLQGYPAYYTYLMKATYYQHLMLSLLCQLFLAVTQLFPCALESLCASQPLPTCQLLATARQMSACFLLATQRLSSINLTSLPSLGDVIIYQCLAKSVETIIAHIETHSVWHLCS